MLKCCPYCLEYLVQKPDESDWAYAKRTYCDKVCAGKNQKNRVKGPAEILRKKDPSWMYTQRGCL